MNISMFTNVTVRLIKIWLDSISILLNQESYDHRSYERNLNSQDFNGI